MLPRELRSAALARMSYAKTILGPVTLNGLVWVDPIWRSLINELAKFTDVTWDLPFPSDHPSWFNGTIRTRPSFRPKVSAEVSADPKSEVIEALRWVRELLSSGQAKPEEIAIAATSTQDWDDHILAYATSSELPVHFSHGIPALSTPEGQGCAALVDVLTNGLSQERVWRLLRRLPNRPFLHTLPADWFAGLPRSAGLRTFDHWSQALAVGRQRTEGDRRVFSGQQAAGKDFQGDTQRASRPGPHDGYLLNPLLSVAPTILGHPKATRAKEQSYNLISRLPQRLRGCVRCALHKAQKPNDNFCDLRHTAPPASAIIVHGSEHYDVGEQCTTVPQSQ